MGITVAKERASNKSASFSLDFMRPRAWFSSWEVYFIVLIAGFLRLYAINVTELDDDQALLFRMAHDAVAHGLLPTISNTASISIAHPPASIFFFMLPAAFSANPLGGALLVAILSTVAVLLTYLFTRRYYGRLAATIAALLYATAAWPIFFARFIWQPNLMPSFVVLFLFTLFWGGVERRKGWLSPALFLLGLLYQFHETTLPLLALVLMVAIFAPETVRWRDLILACIALGLLFFPFFMWELSIKFADIHVISHLSRQPSRIDNQAINYYQLFLQLYGQQPTSADALTRRFIPLLFWVSWLVVLLLVGGYVLTIVGVLKPRFTRMSLPWSKKAPPAHERGHRTWLNGVWNWWLELRASPKRCGLCLLLAWQIVPVLALTRHNVSLHPQYLLVVMPGPFILIGLFVSTVVKRWRGPGQLARVLRSGMYALAALVFVAQLLGSTVAVIDISNGKYNDRDFYFDYYNPLSTLQHALGEADQLAQQQHISRVYITTDSATQTALRYLSEQMRTPTTLFDARHCLVLPNPADGPAVFLVGPYDTLSNALLSQFATAKLVDQPGRLGGPPFRLYIVTTPTTSSSSQVVFGHDLALADAQAQHLYTDAPLQVTRWRFLRSLQPSLNTTYNYIVTASSHSNGETNKQAVTCTFTAIRAGDQLLVASRASGSTLTLGINFYVTRPYNPSYGPLHLETAAGKSTTLTSLHTPTGTTTVTITG